MFACARAKLTIAHLDKRLLFLFNSVNVASLISNDKTQCCGLIYLFFCLFVGCSILMASAMRQVALASKTSLTRRFFSRTALPQLRVSQGDVSSQSRNFDHFILPAALVLTVFGVSVSLFSTHQLSYNSCRSLKK